MGARGSKDITTEKERRRSLKKSESLDENAKYRELRRDVDGAPNDVTKPSEAGGERTSRKSSKSSSSSSASSDDDKSQGGPATDHAAANGHRPEVVVVAVKKDEAERPLVVKADDDDVTQRAHIVVAGTEGTALVVKDTEGTRVVAKDTDGQTVVVKKSEGETVVVKKSEGETVVVKKSEGETVVAKDTEGATVAANDTEGMVVVTKDNEGTTVVVKKSDGETVVVKKSEGETVVVKKSEDETVVVKKSEDETVIVKKREGEIVVAKETEVSQRSGESSSSSGEESDDGQHREAKVKVAVIAQSDTATEGRHETEEKRSDSGEEGRLHAPVIVVTESSPRKEREAEAPRERHEGKEEPRAGAAAVVVVAAKTAPDLDESHKREEAEPGEPAQDSSDSSSVSSDSSEGSVSGWLESAVCDDQDLKDGQMKEVELGETKVLVVRSGGTLHAVGGRCSHYGAPLVQGALCNGRVRCPWHGACFNVTTGDIEDFPGLDSIPKYHVEVHDGKVRVKARREMLEKSRCQKVMAGRCQDDHTQVLIIGGGPAALVCAETLRQEGFGGKITMATREKHLPYDRPRLSKVLDVTPEHIALRDRDFFEKSDIEIKTEKEATRVDCEGKEVTFSDGTQEKFDKLLLAVGTTPRRLPNVPDLENVTTLRTLDDALFIARRAENKDVVLIGTSFIGVETAACLVGKARSVTIVDLVETPFQLALGTEVGQGVRKLLEEKGVKLYFRNSVREFEGEDGRLVGVVLQDDTRLAAQLCVLGVGVVPATDFLKDSGVPMTERGFLTVDKQMRTDKDGVFAAGDITHFPLFLAGDLPANIQHWQMAHQQGRIAALNMLGRDIEIHSVPFFWTVLFGKSIRYTGYGVGYEEVILHGNPDDLKFVAYYIKDDRVVAIATLDSDPLAARAADVWHSGGHISRDDIRDEVNPAWLSLLSV